MEKLKLSSQYGFGEKVLFRTEVDNKPCPAKVVGISYTESKVYYDLDLYHYQDNEDCVWTQLRHVDPVFVHRADVKCSE